MNRYLRLRADIDIIIDLLAVIMAWWITLPVVLTIILCLGLGSGGTLAGMNTARKTHRGHSSLITLQTAAYQGCVYGASILIGGLFTTMTSLAMLGFLALAVALELRP
jgi:hypothetical protein